MIRLKELRLQNKKSQAEIAAVIGVSESTISLYETGKRQPDQQILIKIADYFNVSVDYLLERTNNNVMTMGVLDYAYFRVAYEAQELGILPEELYFVVGLVKKCIKRRNEKPPISALSE